MQMHRRQYVCGVCDEKFPTGDLMAVHLRNHHNESFSESQLPIVLDMCDRPVDDSELSLCILCSEEMYLSKLRDHLATHMEDIALFVLPSDVQDGELDGGSVSNQAAKPKSGAESDGDETTSLDSLHCFDAGVGPNHKQTSADFQKLLSAEHSEVHSKVTFWQENNIPREHNPVTTRPNVAKFLQEEHHDSKLSFCFKIDRIKAKDNAPPTTFVNGSYKPPIEKEHYEQWGSTGWRRWTVNGVSDPTLPPSPVHHTYSTSVFFDGTTGRFLFHPADCRSKSLSIIEQDRTERWSWRQLSFTQIDASHSVLDHNGEYNSLSGKAGSYSPWLLPPCYQSIDDNTFCGLSGKMGLLLALAAFSCKPEHMIDAVVRRLNLRERRWDNGNFQFWGNGRRCTSCK
jgi:hypothetical protein